MVQDPAHQEPAGACKRSGGCLCGAVRYAIDGPVKQVVACHCSMCRRQTGHILATIDAWHAHFRLIEDSGLHWFQSSRESRRGFCKTCGSVLFFETLGSGKISITAGTLDEDADLSLVAHIFVGDKADYYAIDDDVPQHVAGDDGIPMPERPTR
ncbi:MAG: GFA family protein [Pseudomonadota bacterium]